MEYCICNLYELIPSLNESSIKFCLKQIVSGRFYIKGLDILHKSFVVHRDITPSNILIHESG